MHCTNYCFFAHLKWETRKVLQHSWILFIYLIDKRIAFIKAWSGNACTNSDNCSISSRIIEVQSHTFKNHSDLCYWILLQSEMQKNWECYKFRFSRNNLTFWKKDKEAISVIIYLQKILQNLYLSLFYLWSTWYCLVLKDDFSHFILSQEISGIIEHSHLPNAFLDLLISNPSTELHSITTTAAVTKQLIFKLV